MFAGPFGDNETQRGGILTDFAKFLPSSYYTPDILGITLSGAGYLSKLF